MSIWTKDIPFECRELPSLIHKYDLWYYCQMTWFDIYNEFIRNFDKISQLQQDYIRNLERINHLYDESIKSMERVNELYNKFVDSYEKMNRLYDQQFNNMQRMNQRWLDVFSKSWEQQQEQGQRQNEKH